MNPYQRAVLQAVNDRWNAVPYDAMPGPGEPPDYYTDKPAVGYSWVCRMYVQAKASMLKDQGWPGGEALLELLCYTEPVPDYPNGEHHAVLRVLIDGESWVLDSRFNGEAGVYAYTAPPAGYRWDARQVAGTTEFAPIG